MPCLPALSQPWEALSGQIHTATAYTHESFGATLTFMELYVLTGQCVQELWNKGQACSIPERIKRLQRARRTFGDIRRDLDDIYGVVGNQPLSYGAGVSDSFNITPYDPKAFNTFDAIPYGPESEDIARIRNQCDVIIRSVRDRLSKAVQEQQDSSVDSNGMLSRASPITYGDDEWMHDASLDINRMLSMAAFGPFATRHNSATLGRDYQEPAGNPLSNRNEMPPSSARRDGEAASQPPGNTLQQATPHGKSPEKNANKITQGRSAELSAVDRLHQQGLPAAEKAAISTQTRTDQTLRLTRSSSPVPLPLPTDLTKLPKFKKKKKKREEAELWAQTGEPHGQKQTAGSGALRRQEASPWTSQPVTNPGRKRSASSSSERTSGAGPAVWYKKQRTGPVGAETPKNGTHQPRAASCSNRPAAAGPASRIPASLPPKPPVSMPTSQHMSAVTQATHGTGLTQHASPVTPSHTSPLASVLGSTKGGLSPSKGFNVPSTGSPYGSRAQHSPSYLPQRNYARYRQPAPASSLRGLSQPTLLEASGSAGPEATRPGSGHQLAGQASAYSRAHQAHGRHTGGAVPRSLPAAPDAGQHRFFPTGHRQPPWSP